MSTDPKEPSTLPPSAVTQAAKDVTKGLVGDFVALLKWTLAGAIVGAVLFGGAGWYLLSLDFAMYATGAGALIGGGATAWFYGTILG